MRGAETESLMGKMRKKKAAIVKTILKNVREQAQDPNDRTKTQPPKKREHRKQGESEEGPDRKSQGKKTKEEASSYERTVENEGEKRRKRAEEKGRSQYNKEYEKTKRGIKRRADTKRRVIDWRVRTGKGYLENYKAQARRKRRKSKRMSKGREKT